MILKTIFNGVLIFHLTKVTSDEDFIRPCEDYNTSRPDNYFDTSNLQVKRLENGPINIYGSVGIIRGFSESHKMELSLEFYKKERGSWLNTIYNFHRSDLCRSLFDPTEIWHIYAEKIPKEQRKCPLYNGQIFTTNISTDNKFSLANPRMAGDYKAHFTISSDSFEKPLCCNIFIEVYRV